MKRTNNKINKKYVLRNVGICPIVSIRLYGAAACMVACSRQHDSEFV